MAIHLDLDIGEQPPDADWGELFSQLAVIFQQTERLIEMASAAETKVAQLEAAVQSMQTEMSQMRERVATKDDLFTTTAAELVAIKAAAVAVPADTTDLENRIQGVIDTINADTSSLGSVEAPPPAPDAPAPVAVDPQAANPNPASTEPNPLPGVDPAAPAPVVTTESGAATSPNTTPVDPAANVDTTASAGGTPTAG